MKLPLSVILSVISGLFPLLAGVWVYKKLKRELKLIFIFFIVAFLFEIIFLLTSLNQIRNLWLFHIYTLIEFGFWGLYFFYQLKSTKFSVLIKWLMVIFLMIWIAAKFLGEQFTYLNDFTRPLESTILVVFSAIAIFQLQKDYLFSLWKNPRFWINVGVLIYFSGNIFLFSLVNLVLYDTPDIWIIHSFLNIITNICYAGGLLCTRLRLKYGSWLSLAE